MAYFFCFSGLIFLSPLHLFPFECLIIVPLVREQTVRIDDDSCSLYKLQIISLFIFSLSLSLDCCATFGFCSFYFRDSCVLNSSYVCQLIVVIYF